MVWFSLERHNRNSIYILLQIRESKWLSGVNWPDCDTKFRRFPMKFDLEAADNKDDNNFSDIETKTREALSEIGIEEKILESHIERGPRSHVIGAFRIAQTR